MVQIYEQLSTKYTEAFEGRNKRYRREILKGLGALFSNLIKKQISVTTSVFRNFNATIQKLQIHEETLYNDLVEIKRTF